MYKMNEQSLQWQHGTGWKGRVLSTDQKRSHTGKESVDHLVESPLNMALLITVKIQCILQCKL